MLLTSCNEDYKDVSKSEFSKKILLKVDVKRLEIKNNEEILIYTDEITPYRIKMNTSTEIQEFVDFLNSNDDNITIGYTTNPIGFQFGLLQRQTLHLIIPLIILSHIVLLWIALRKIIKSESDNMEKILYAFISIFFPFFGSLIYLTTKRHS